MHLLLIILLVVAVLKIATAGHSSPYAAAAVETGLRRLGFVLALAAGALGAVVGYAIGRNDVEAAQGAAAAGFLIGFVLLWIAMRVVIWIITGFMGRA
jgi:hypothetical protein